MNILNSEQEKSDSERWKTIDWKQSERYVFKLQTRIYSASKVDDIRLVRKLQRILLHSWNAKLLAVRRVTQDNIGKKTAGIDGVKILSPKNGGNLHLI